MDEHKHLFSIQWENKKVLRIKDNAYRFWIQYVHYNLWYVEDLEIPFLVFCMANSDDLRDELDGSMIIQL